MEKFTTILDKYHALKLNEVIDFAKFNEYAIVHHSSGIEGSTLTETETQLLLDEGITPKGKPLEHSLMVKDHYEALLFVLSEAKKKKTITVQLLREINSLAMKSTGKVRNTVFGKMDESKGEFRKGNVRAGESYFVNYDKVIPYTTELVKSLNKKIKIVKTDVEKLELAFTAHFDLVSIHPFYDGNGRTSRLLMNFIQRFFGLPLSIVYKEDKAEYIQALKDSRAEETTRPFVEFMFSQLNKQLTAEIKLYNTELKPKGKGKKSSGGSMFF
jgi:Fic family protein